ncbi:MAG: glutamine synthetase [SAR324 cluster bacterium]|nr:glutamine synthetase [SAR324 cluster bacterium]
MPVPESIREAKNFLVQFPEIENIDLLIPDTNGIFRGKRIGRQDLVKVYQEGVYFPGSTFALDITGHTVEASGLSFDIGDADQLCRPIPGTLQSVPWKDPLSGQVLLTMYQQEEELFFASARNVLHRVLDRFSDLKLTPVVAVEMEFYLLERRLEQDEPPQPPLSPVTGIRESATQVYSMENLDDYQEFLLEVSQVSNIQNIPVNAAIAEYAPGQFEVNLHHQPDPLGACDHAMLLKRIIKGVARKHEMDATFMAKPYMECSGNGTHIHLSLLDEEGNNVFKGEERHEINEMPKNEFLQHAVGGLLETMNEGMAIFAPNANSFKRFQNNNYVPMCPNWGWNNRTTAIRIPSGPPNATRIEHRVAGADSNPYLLLAALLAGIDYGIRHCVKPYNFVVGNGYEQHESSLPDNWKEALESLKNGKILPDYLGEQYCKMYLACKTEEMQAFQQHISRLEYQWYLNAV